MTPNFAVLGIETPRWHTPRLWLPLFLLWIPVALLSPVIFLILVAVAIAGRTTPGTYQPPAKELKKGA